MPQPGCRRTRRGARRCRAAGRAHHSNLDHEAVVLKHLVQHCLGAVLGDVAHEELDGVGRAARGRLGAAGAGHVLGDGLHDLLRGRGDAVAEVAGHAGRRKVRRGLHGHGCAAHTGVR